jgi:outer membrane protein TolC
MMSEKIPESLPMIGTHPMEEETASCAPKIYVSNEEMALLAAMRELRSRAKELRGRIDSGASPDERRELQAQLDELRAQRTDLAARREEAYKRKMIMLGHLPPDDEVRLF